MDYKVNATDTTLVFTGIKSEKKPPSFCNCSPSSDNRLCFLHTHGPSQELPECKGEQEEAECTPRDGYTPANPGLPAATHGQVIVVTQRVYSVTLGTHVVDLGHHYHQ